jgi:hypothetical protein
MVKGNKKGAKNRLPEILKSPKSSSTFAHHCCGPASQPRSFPSFAYARLLKLWPFPNVEPTPLEDEKKKKEKLFLLQPLLERCRDDVL